MLNVAWTTAIADYLNAQRSAGYPDTTIELRRQHLEHLARRVDADPWALTARALIAYTGSQRWAPETRRSRRTTLRGFYDWAVADGRTDTNIAVALPKVRPTVPAPRPLPNDVYRDALRRASDDDALILRMAREAGMRRTEIAVAHSRDLFQDLDGWSIVVHGKGGKDRSVPLSHRLALELRSRGDGYVLPGRVDGHMSPRWVGTRIARLLPGSWTLHTGRHGFATDVAEREGIEVARGLLGHASVATTQRYVYVRPTRARAVVEAIAEAAS